MVMNHSNTIYIDLSRKEGDQLQWLQEQEKRFENFQDSERHKKEEVLL